MDIWDAPVGQQVDLGELRPAQDPDRLPGLAVAGQVLGLVAEHVRATPGTHLTNLSWQPAEAGGDTSRRLQLTLAARPAGAAIATLRLYAVDPAGNRQLLADLRCRRTTPRPAPVADLLTTPVRPDEHHRRTFPVTTTMLTHHVPDAQAVLSTPALIAIMEDTAADILRRRFSPGAASVGTWIGVRHTGPALLDERVTVTAAVVDVRGRRITFDVRACVGDRAIGDGQVTQTVIRGGRR